MNVDPAISVYALAFGLIVTSYMALRDRLFDAVVSGQKPEMPALKWSPLTVQHMATAVTIR